MTDAIVFTDWTSPDDDTFPSSDEMQAELDALRTIAAQLAEALADVQWPGDVSAAITHGVIVECPMCERGYKEGHAEDCSLAAALEAWEAYQR